MPVALLLAEVAVPVLVPMHFADPVEHALVLLEHGASYDDVAVALLQRGVAWDVLGLQLARWDPRWGLAVRLMVAIRGRLADWWGMGREEL